MGDQLGPVITDDGGVAPGSAVKRLVIILANRVVKAYFYFQEGQPAIGAISQENTCSK